jgi:hypothetical protein
MKPKHYPIPEVCLDFLKGKCGRRAPQCRYMHPDLSEFRQLCGLMSSVAQAEICEVHAMTGQCKFGSRCNKFHISSNVGALSTQASSSVEAISFDPAFFMYHPPPPVPTAAPPPFPPVQQSSRTTMAKYAAEVARSVEAVMEALDERDWGEPSRKSQGSGT